MHRQCKMRRMETPLTVYKFLSDNLQVETVSKDGELEVLQIMSELMLSKQQAGIRDSQRSPGEVRGGSHLHAARSPALQFALNPKPCQPGILEVNR